MKKLLAACMLILFANTSFAQENPSVFLEDIANKMLVLVKKHQSVLKTDKKLAEELVKKTLLPAIDTKTFSRKTLTSGSWKKLSNEQKARFTNEFINLVVSNYAVGLSLYNGQTFKFSKPIFSKTGKLAKVRSSMVQKGSTPIIIDYVLSIKTGAWKIIDLTIEGVNMSKSYRSQFLPRLKSMGIEAFLVDMETKRKTAAAKQVGKSARN